VYFFSRLSIKAKVTKALQQTETRSMQSRAQWPYLSAICKFMFAITYLNLLSLPMLLFTVDFVPCVFQKKKCWWV